MTKARFGAPVQIGYIVSNLDESIASWNKTAGVGPWLIFRNAKMVGQCRGTQTEVTMDVAMGYLGDTQIELIQQTSDTVSPYRNDEGQPLLGIHHIGWLIDDRDAEVVLGKKNGLSVVFEAENPSTKVAYLQDPSQPGVLLELIESEITADLIRKGIVDARNWDGVQLTTEIDLAS